MGGTGADVLFAIASRWDDANIMSHLAGFGLEANLGSVDLRLIAQVSMQIHREQPDPASPKASGPGTAGFGGQPRSSRYSGDQSAPLGDPRDDLFMISLVPA